METFVTVIFWLLAVKVLLRVVVLAVVDFPFTEEFTKGWWTLYTVSLTGMLLWAGHVKYGWF